MLKNYSNSLSLLLPVYRGENLFEGAIKSIEESAIDFENIFVSFNGSDSADYDLFMQMSNQNKLRKKYTLFQTLEDLSAVQHSHLITKNLSEILHPSSMLMLLAHDDRLIASESATLSSGIFSKLNADTIYIPSYSFCWASDYNKVTRVVESVIDMSPKEFFWRTMKETIPTNMSGMIMPFFAFVEAQKTLERYTNGARFEHMLCIARSIKCVCFTTDVRVLIGERMDSDGRLLTILEHRKAALHYMRAYLRNGRLSGINEWPKFFIHFSRKIAGYLLAKIQAN